MNTDYNPGLHIASTLKTQSVHLKDASTCKIFYDSIIKKLNLHKVGEVYHEFDNKSFTAVICLTESHISIHTWPEYGHVTFDVFLSNYKEDNTVKARSIYEETLAFFNAVETNKHEILR